MPVERHTDGERVDACRTVRGGGLGGDIWALQVLQELPKLVSQLLEVLSVRGGSMYLCAPLGGEERACVQRVGGDDERRRCMYPCALSSSSH